jgi:hypothetical protein
MLLKKGLLKSKLPVVLNVAEIPEEFLEVRMLRFWAWRGRTRPKTATNATIQHNLRCFMMHSCRL